MRKVVQNFVLFYLRFWARLALWWHRPCVVGITGSVGKSSCKNAVFAVLHEKLGERVKMIEKGNSETGIPLGIVGLTIVDYTTLGWAKTLLRVPLGLRFLRGTEYLVVEMGIDDPFEPKNMSYLLKIVKPDIAIFLNVHPVHTEQFSRVAKEKEDILRAIAREKGKIITESGARVGIYNKDNPYVREVVEKVKTVGLYSFGKGEENFVSYKGWEISFEGTRFSYKTPKGELMIFLRGYLLPKAYLQTLAPALIVGFLLEIRGTDIKRALEKNFTLPPSRATLLEGIKNSWLIDSSYNASFVSTREMLSLAFVLSKKYQRELVFCFGDMRELGPLAEKEHREMAKEIRERVDRVYLVGELTKNIVLPELQKGPGKVREVRWFESSKALGEYLKESISEKSLVLFKGSQNTIFLEEAVKLVLRNPADKKKLCRQAPFWIKKKEKWFREKRN